MFAGTTVELTGENGGELNSIDASGGALDGTRGRPARLVSDDPTDKYQDFVSRLDVSATLDEDEATEAGPQVQVTIMYSAILHLVKQHPDVKAVTAAVLRRCWQLHPRTSMRTLRKITEGFRSIQDGLVRKRNMPSEAEIEEIFARSRSGLRGENYSDPNQGELGLWANLHREFFRGTESQPLPEALDAIEVRICMSPEDPARGGRGD